MLIYYMIYKKKHYICTRKGRDAGVVELARLESE